MVSTFRDANANNATPNHLLLAYTNATKPLNTITIQNKYVALNKPTMNIMLANKVPKNILAVMLAKLLKFKLMLKKAIATTSMTKPTPSMGSSWFKLNAIWYTSVLFVKFEML